MALETPSVKHDNPTLYDLLKLCDFVFLLIFTAEAVIKIVAMGLFCYIDDNWNKLDCSIVLFGWFDFLGRTLDLGYFKTLRMLRAFKALRMLNKIKGLQDLVRSLMASLVSLSNVIGVTLLVWLIFGTRPLHRVCHVPQAEHKEETNFNSSHFPAFVLPGIFAVSHLKGKFYLCTVGHHGRGACVGSAVDPSGTGSVTQPSWINRPVNFERI